MEFLVVVPNRYQPLSAGQPKKKSSRGLLLTLFGWLRNKRDDVLPATASSMMGRATLKPHTV